MVVCCKNCSPSCEFCIYAKRSEFVVNGVTIKTSIDGCKKHLDEHHQSMARSLGYCLDFHCFKVEEEKTNGT